MKDMKIAMKVLGGAMMATVVGMAAQAAATRDDDSELITSSGASEDIGE